MEGDKLYRTSGPSARRHSRRGRISRTSHEEVVEMFEQASGISVGVSRTEHNILLQSEVVDAILYAADA